MTIQNPIPPHARTPQASVVLFDEFFETGKEEELSPFITDSSKSLSINLPLRAALFSAVLLVFAYVCMFLSYPIPLQHLLLLFIYILAGIPALIESIEDLASFQVNIDVLMTLAAFGSILIGSPFEGALLLVLFSISGAMEEAVTRKAKASIKSLHKLSPTRANVIGEDGIALEKAIQEVPVYAKILIKAGQTVPLDGKILEGTSSLNFVHLTGESLPVTKKPGDQIPAGALNIDGALVVEVTHTSQDSTLARIIRLVTEAQEAKPTLQRFFDKVSQRYASSIISLSLLFALSFPALLGIPFLGHEGSIYRALTFLIAASPCALIIAIPIAYLSAIGSCARNGIVLKGGITLDALATCKTIAFDKTGTLTTGELHCLGFEPLHPELAHNKDEALKIAFALEQNAVHPIAKAITLYAIEKGETPAPIEQFLSIPGYGLEATFKGKKIYLGKPDFIESKLPEKEALLLKEKVETLRKKGELLALLLIENTLYLFRFQDSIRKEIKKTLTNLKSRGYKLLMLTGDHPESAHRIAKEIGIDEVYADLKPEDKLEIVASRSAQEGLVMIGDGVNDAPALARATVGISMGKVGSSSAIEAADIVLLNDNIDKLDWLTHKAKMTKIIVKQNLFLSTCAIIIASTPALAGIIPLWLAVVMHEGGTVIVGLNGLRLLRN
ncbi:MAG: heavy metal translocating P-type ATPase [Parachlamydiaceae bacterium]